MSIASYRSRRIETASSVQIVVMLFQETLRRIELAATSLENGKVRDATGHFQHARNVIAELLGSLEPVPGAEQLVAKLASLYVWSAAELGEARRDRDPVRARQVVRALEPLLEAWHEVANQSLR